MRLKFRIAIGLSALATLGAIAPGSALAGNPDPKRLAALEAAEADPREALYQAIGDDLGDLVWKLREAAKVADVKNSRPQFAILREALDTVIDAAIRWNIAPGKPGSCASAKDALKAAVKRGVHLERLYDYYVRSRNLYGAGELNRVIYPLHQLKDYLYVRAPAAGAAAPAARQSNTVASVAGMSDGAFRELIRALPPCSETDLLVISRDPVFGGHIRTMAALELAFSNGNYPDDFVEQTYERAGLGDLLGPVEEYWYEPSEDQAPPLPEEEKRG